MLQVTEDKYYPRAEFAASGARESFYQGNFHPLAHGKEIAGLRITLSACEAHDYAVPFVPTTTVFDIQDDNSLDYNYHVSDRLFFRVPAEHDESNLYGYPHNNPAITNVSDVTPFVSCFASPDNEFHLQNPSKDLRNFILLETRTDLVELQNRTIAGHSSETYQARYEARNKILIGKAITFISPEGQFVVDQHTDVEMEAPRIEIKSGFHAKAGASLSIKASTADPLPAHCFTFVNDNPEGAANKTDEYSQEQTWSNQERAFDQLKVFPNPNRGDFTIQVPAHLIGGELIIRDLLGRVIYQQTAFSSSIELRNLSLPQISFLNIIYNHHLETAKIIQL